MHRNVKTQCHDVNKVYSLVDNLFILLLSIYGPARAFSNRHDECENKYWRFSQDQFKSGNNASAVMHMQVYLCELQHMVNRIKSSLHFRLEFYLLVCWNKRSINTRIKRKSFKCHYDSVSAIVLRKPKTGAARDTYSSVIEVMPTGGRHRGLPYPVRRAVSILATQNPGTERS